MDLPESVGYRVKRKLLGPPLTTDQLQHEKLSKKLALGVLSSDCISSSAYGSEEILLILLPTFGLAAYGLLLPMTGVVLAVLVLVTLSYRSVVMVYTHAGGSYVVARENFGPVVAQVAAVALMIDYIVTVAVQAAAGTSAVTSAVPGLNHGKVPLTITVGVVVVLFYGNLRGLREAGRTFAFPTYFFAFSMVVVIVGGIAREVLGDLPKYATHVQGGVPIGTGHSILSAMAVFVLLRSFANGGSSLTGLEAISNGVSAFKPPQGLNARRTLVVMSCILGTLVAGVSWLAHETHAVAYEAGSPTVISQVAKAVFGDSLVGHALFLLVQLATMLILYTGANTPFNGFPFLANFVAADGFLPRWLTKRGHRLAFSNGIVVLTFVSIALIIATGGHVNNLVAFLRDRRLHRLHAGRLRDGEVLPHPPAARVAGEGRRQPGLGDHLGGRGRDLRRHQVHRGRLGGAGALPDPGRRAAPAALHLPSRGRGAGHGDRGVVRCGQSRSRSTVLLLVDSGRPGRPACGSLRRKPCAHPSCGRCTSSSTQSMPRPCERSGTRSPASRSRSS